MSDVSIGKGNCLCGAVQLTANTMQHKVGACHCDMCRRWGCGPFMEVNCGSDVSFEGEDNISVFESSDWAERGFCSQCGTHLFYRLKQGPQYMVPVGLFNNADNLVFDNQVFIDEKPPFYSFSNTTKNLTGAEIFALFAPPEKQ